MTKKYTPRHLLLISQLKSADARIALYLRTIIKSHILFQSSENLGQGKGNATLNSCTTCTSVMLTRVYLCLNPLVVARHDVHAERGDANATGRLRRIPGNSWLQPLQKSYLCHTMMHCTCLPDFLRNARVMPLKQRTSHLFFLWNI